MNDIGLFRWNVSGSAVVAGTVDIVIERRSTDGERDRLVGVLKGVRSSSPPTVR
jgi:hypothetical protein